MSDYIGYFLNLCHHIIEAGEKLDNIYVVHAILLPLPCSSIWDVIKQNLLDKGKALTLDIVSTKLISVHDHNEHDQVVEETKKKAKAEQLALLQLAHLEILQRKTKRESQWTNQRSPKFGHLGPSAIHADRKDISPLSVPINRPKRRIVSLDLVDLQMLQLMLFNL